MSRKAVSNALIVRWPSSSSIWRRAARTTSSLLSKRPLPTWLATNSSSCLGKETFMATDYHCQAAQATLTGPALSLAGFNSIASGSAQGWPHVGREHNGVRPACWRSRMGSDGQEVAARSITGRSGDAVLCLHSFGLSVPCQESIGRPHGRAGKYPRISVLIQPSHNVDMTQL